MQIKRTCYFAAVAVLAATHIAAAQQPQPPMPIGAAPPDQEFMQISREWDAVMLALEHLQDRLRQMGASRGNEKAMAVRQLQELRAYAVACGDKLGCFVPVPETHSEAAPKP